MERKFKKQQRIWNEFSKNKENEIEISKPMCISFGIFISQNATPTGIEGWYLKNGKHILTEELYEVFCREQ